MLSPREFLLQECRNVGELLRDVLRYDYGPAGSRDFYDECNSRLKVITGFANQAKEYDRKEIRVYARELSHLSRLIAQIERSHIGEYPWAFGEALKRLAERLCAEHTLDSADQIEKAGQPLFFIMAEGGLSAFEARKDANLARLCKRQVFTIVVPRSLKHHVLLHAVLGHEVCHSGMWRSRLFGRMDTACAALGKITPLSDSKKLLEWMDKACPQLKSKFEPSAEDARRRWLRELLCDLFGLVFMGPSYFAAVRTMLGLTDPTGEHIDAGHPPHVWRYQLLEYAYKELGWDKPLPMSVSKPVRQAAKKFNDKLFDYNHSAMLADKVIRKELVETATRRLTKLLAQIGQFHYQPPNAEVIEQLIADIRGLRPPIGQTITESDVKFAQPEFRQILHVGWVACHAGVEKELPDEAKKDTFTIISRLCEQAIIQTRAINDTRNSHQKSGRNRVRA